MFKVLILFSLAFALAGLPVLAQSADQASSQADRKDMIMTGSVKTFDAGKTIIVEVKGKTHTYDLTKTDVTVTVNPDVKTGTEVKVTERVDSTGHKTITIEPASGGPNR